MSECAAAGCAAAVHPSRLMCRAHWFLVPKVLRDRVWDSYRRGQETDPALASAAYMAAYHAAVAHVARREGKPEAAARHAASQRRYEAIIEKEK